MCAYAAPASRSSSSAASAAALAAAANAAAEEGAEEGRTEAAGKGLAPDMKCNPLDDVGGALAVSDNPAGAAGPAGDGAVANRDAAAGGNAADGGAVVPGRSGGTAGAGAGGGAGVATTGIAPHATVLEAPPRGVVLANADRGAGVGDGGTIGAGPGIGDGAPDIIDKWKGFSHASLPSELTQKNQSMQLVHERFPR